MANIDLNKLFAHKQSIVSTVDSDIILNKPKKVDEIYSDLKLDLNPIEYLSDSINSKKTNNDIEKIINE